MEEKFDFNKYRNEYDKEHYSQFKAKLKKQDMEELNELLKKYGINKTQFVMKAKEKLERGRLIMKKVEYIIDEQRVEPYSDYINSNTFDNKEDAESEFERLKDLSKNSRVSDNITRYTLLEVVYEIDEDGEELDDGNFTELDSFETDRIL